MSLHPRRSRSTVRMPLAATLLLLAGGLCAQEEPTPIRFEDQAGWVGGVIDDSVAADPNTRQIVRITADHDLAKGLVIRQPKAGKQHQGIRMRGTNTDGAEAARTLTLGGPLSVDFGREGSVSVNFDARITFDFAGSPAVFEAMTQDSHIEISGPIRNATGLIRRGNSARVHLDNPGPVGVTGPVEVDGGWLTLHGQATLPGATALSITSREHSAFFSMESEGAIDRLPDPVPITVSGGAGINLSGTSNERPTSEMIGRITQRDSVLQLQVRGKNSSAPTTLTVAGLVRDPASTLIVGGEKLGTAAFVKIVDDAAILAALKGGGGVAGSTTISIVPWARGLGYGNLHESFGFLTYDRVGGFRDLERQKEYVSGLQAAARPGDNVRITTEDPPLAKAKTINALFCNIPRTVRYRVVDLGGKALTITSGALSAECETSLIDGTLTTGNAQPLSFVGIYNLNVRLAGNGGAIFQSQSYQPTRVTNPANSLTGDWVVAGGKLVVTDDEIIPDQVTVRLHPGATLSIEGSESVAAIAGNGMVRPAVGGRSMVMLGRCIAQANQVVMGIGGAIRPGDQSKEPAIGALHLWNAESDDRIGFLKIEDGTLAIDVAADGHDAVVLETENKAAVVSGGTLRVNRLGGFAPKVGTSWEVISGTAPATGRGFDAIVDAAGKGYAYSAAAVGNTWVLTVTAEP